MFSRHKGIQVRQAREKVKAIRGTSQEQGEVGDCGREDKRVSMLAQTDKGTEEKWPVCVTTVGYTTVWCCVGGSRDFKEQQLGIKVMRIKCAGGHDSPAWQFHDLLLGINGTLIFVVVRSNLSFDIHTEIEQNKTFNNSFSPLFLCTCEIQKRPLGIQDIQFDLFSNLEIWFFWNKAFLCECLSRYSLKYSIIQHLQHVSFVKVALAVRF